VVTVLALLGVLGVLFVAAVLSTREGPILADAPADVADVPLPDGPLQPEDVGRLRFSLAARGYRMSEVDLALERLAVELTDRDRRIALLEAAAHGHEQPEQDLPAAPREATPADLPLAEPVGDSTARRSAVAVSGAAAVPVLAPASAPAAVPVESAPVEVAPVEVAPVAAAPAEVGPVGEAPVEEAPVGLGTVEVPPVGEAPVAAADATPPDVAEVAAADAVPPLPPVTVHAPKTGPDDPVDPPAAEVPGVEQPSAVEQQPVSAAPTASGATAATTDVGQDAPPAALEETGEPPAR
jgi:DivIVA domain-containing protein